MVLVERDTDLRLLDRLLSESAAGRGHVVVIEGTASSGKTELLRAFADRAADARFLTATCSRAERTLALGVVSQLFMSAPMTDDLRRQVTGLLDSGTAHATQDTDTLEPEIVRVFHRLSLALLELTKDSTVVLAVDDVHHADRLSVHCLLHLIRRMTSARCLIVVAIGTHLPQTHLSLRAELMRQPNVDRIRLAPLTIHGVTRLLAARLDDASAKALAPRFHAISGGNPLLLNALLEDHLTTSSAPAHAYRTALLSCLHRADPFLLRVIRVLAILDRERDITDIADLAGLDADLVCRAIHTLTEAGLLADGRFPHAATRTSVLSDLSAQEAADLHQRAARLLHERGGAATAIAHHLVEAQRAEPPWTVPVLTEAAEQAMLAGESEFATQCLKLAYRSCTDEEDRTRVQVRLAHAEWHHNPSTAARQLTPLLAAARAGRLDGPDRLVLIMRLLWHDRTDEATELLADVRTRLRDGEPAASRELHDFELWLTCSHPPLTQRRNLPPVGKNSTMTMPNTDPWLRSAAVLADLLTSGHWDHAVNQAIKVLQDIHLGRGSGWAEEAAALALMVLVYADSTDAATEWCHRLREEMGSRSSAALRAVYSATSAEIALRVGDLPAAVANAEAALAELPIKGWGVTVGLPLGSLILADTRMGRYEEAAKLLAHAVPEAMFQSRWGLHYLHARGHYYLATNHAHAALADFLSCGELMRAWGLDVAGLVPWRASAAEAWFSLGNADQARHLAHDQLGRPGTDGSRARGLALRQLATASPTSRRLQLLTEALDIFESVRDRFEQARVLSDLSRAYSAVNDKRRARQLLRRALHVANVCEAAPLSRDLLAVSGAPKDVAKVAGDNNRRASLTGSERRVASLAVMGYTNREIAAKLYITASTVEQHLTRIYRKLNVKCRKDLPADLWAKTSTIG